jgi:hypothetical protein
MNDPGINTPPPQTQGLKLREWRKRRLWTCHVEVLLVELLSPHIYGEYKR